MATGILEKLKLPVKKLGEFKREANRRGVSAEAYLKEVVEDHLDRMKRIQNSTFFELAAPIREALKGLSEPEIDAMVDKARKSRRIKKNGQ